MYLAARGHMYSSMRTRILWYEDTYIVARGHIFSRMRKHMYAPRAEAPEGPQL